jgi:hypothetical protein
MTAKRRMLPTSAGFLPKRSAICPKRSAPRGLVASVRKTA